MSGGSFIIFADPTLNSLATGALLATIALVWIVVLVRMVGLRSFSKMTSFDFVMTIAMGSLVASASQSTDTQAFLRSMAAMAALFLVQFSAAILRRKSDAAASLLQNEPVLLMREGAFIEEALAKTRVSRADIYAKLRQANVRKLDDVRAVVLETTGDVSVLHGGSLEPILLEGVQRT